jgi:hypothetical protein
LFMAHLGMHNTNVHFHARFTKNRNVHVENGWCFAWVPDGTHGRMTGVFAFRA